MPVWCKRGSCASTVLLMPYRATVKEDNHRHHHHPHHHGGWEDEYYGDGWDYGFGLDTWYSSELPTAHLTSITISPA